LIYVYMLMIIIWITCWWNITWRYVYMLMNYYMHAYVEFNMMTIWCCNYMMNIYEIIMSMLLLLTLSLMSYVVVVDVVVDVLRCWCCQCCWCRQVVGVVRCCWLSCWVHAYSYKVRSYAPALILGALLQRWF